MKIHALKFGFACSMFWFVSVLLIGLASTFFDYATAFVTLFSSIYIGFGPTLLGTCIGAGWALVDGFLCGWILSSLYNYLVGKQ